MEKERKKINLFIHYLDDTSISKGVWFFKKDSSGRLVNFEPIDDGFGGQVAICEISNPKEGDSYGFVVAALLDGKLDWSCKDGVDRFVRINKNIIQNGEIHIYALPENKNHKILFHKPRMINFHYRREQADYEGWKLYIYLTGSYGNSYSFKEDKNNPGYVFTQVPADLYSDHPRKIWFKTFKETPHNTDERMNRCINVNEMPQTATIDVYLINFDTKIYFEKPKILHSHITLYYHRHDNDYDGWSIRYFIDKRNNFQRFVENFCESVDNSTFRKITFDVDYLENAKELNFYLRKGEISDPIDFRRVELKPGNLELYMVQDVFKVFSSKKEALQQLSGKILKATFNNPGENNLNFNTIWLETNIQLSKDIISELENFSITGNNKSKVDIVSIQYSDSSFRRFRIEVKDRQIQPYEVKYNLAIHYFSDDGLIKFDKSARISIQRLFDRHDFNQKFCYIHEDSNLDFGLNADSQGCQFSLWSPTADKVKLNIYDNPNDLNPSKTYNMKIGSTLWHFEFSKEDSKELIGKYYTYEITEGNHCSEVVDPYSRSCSVNCEKSAIIDLTSTNPKGWENHKRPSEHLSNPIIYEMHIKDFTMGKGSDVPVELQGTYAGVIHKISHLKNLGVNCVQLLPVTKFISDETKPHGGDYNWGYDQLGLWFVPEGSYSSAPHNPIARIIEFKEMVMAFHENDIRVIIDAVHNHTYETENSILNKTITNYYYRTKWDDTFSNGSGCGNELKSERPIVGKLIRDSLKYWVKEMGVDGFRFDLMSLTDKFTMKKIRDDIDHIRPYILLYGEAYKMGWSILPYDLQSSKENILSKELSEIGAFTDVGSRNAIRGLNYQSGLATGANSDSNSSFLFFIGQKGEFIDFQSRNNPTHLVYNYIDIHDDLLLIDYLRQPCLNMSNHETIQRYKLAYTMLFNYIGPIVLKSGFECLTTKRGDNNSYRSEDVNLLQWVKLEKHANILQYFSNYIKFRISHPAFVMKRHDVNTKFECMDCHNGLIKGKLFKDHANGDPCNKLLIYHNISKAMLEVSLPFEPNGWAILANDEEVGNKRIGNPVALNLAIPPLTTIVLGDNSSVERLMKNIPPD